MAIKRLDAAVISMIAAGEVVSRPASALKELVENSIDSGAKDVHVEISDGGITMLKVRDDGCGIAADELTIAVQPHATSKLQTATDLDNIASLGFRGEALAAIASLSNMTVRSRTADRPDGVQLDLSGNWRDEQPVPCVMQAGTEIVVRDLFIHAPARRKFLRTPPTEWAHCDHALRDLAIANPQVGISCIRDGVLRYELPAQEPRDRVVKVLKFKDTTDFQQFDHRSGPLRVHGFIDIAGHATADRQHLIVNGRTVKDRLLRTAVRKGLDDITRETGVPYALFIEIPPLLVDVNAHPAKTEVRFRESNAVFRVVHDAIRTIGEQPLTANPQIRIDSSYGSGRRRQRSGARDLGQRMLPDMPPPAPPAPAADPAAGKRGDQVLQTQQEPDAKERQGGKSPRFGRVLGVLHGIYLLAESDEGLVIVDIHAAHERIIYERMKKMHRDNPQSQQFIDKIELDLSSLALDICASHRKTLAELGFVLACEDGVEYLESLPAVLAGKVDDPARLMVAIIDDLAHGGLPQKGEQLVDELLATAACHAAVRGSNPFLAKDDLAGLLREMETTSSSGRCNHGRPTWRVLGIKELDIYFDRGR